MPSVIRRTSRLRPLLISLCALLLFGCASNDISRNSLPLPDPMGDALGRPEYQIGPGDLLQVKVFQVDDLEREVRVDNEGRIILPLIGTVQAAGRSLHDLQLQVTQRYAERYLQDPQVSILIEEFTSQRITVGGAVTEPGVYPLVGTHLTLQQAIATAKGVSNISSRRNIVVFRKAGGEKLVARFDLVEIEKGAAADPDIYAGDIVVVYRSDARVLLSTIIALTPIVTVFRAYR